MQNLIPDIHNIIELTRSLLQLHNSCSRLETFHLSFPIYDLAACSSNNNCAFSNCSRQQDYYLKVVSTWIMHVQYVTALTIYCRHGTVLYIVSELW